MISVRSDREQAEIVDAILKERLDTVLKDAMQESGIDTWLILSREYCEDPLFKLLTPAMYLTARRLTILIFHLENDKVGKYCCNIADPLLESIYTNIYTDNSNNQFVVLNEFLKELKPQKIALNYSNNYAYFDGLSKALYDKLQSNLDKELSSRFISSESLGILYCEKRSPLELQYYPEIVKVAESIIEEAFSPEFIKPGVTTTEDVEWKMKQSIKDLGLSYWFSPDVNLQNSKDGETMQTGLINKGDLLHCDFGLTYLNLNTDTQRLAYVLKDGEIGIPEDIQRAYDRNMDFHKIVSDNFKEGISGNEIFSNALKEGKEAGLQPMLYSHPLGLFGHAPGPLIGLYSSQKEVHPSGDLLIHDSTAYALELNTRDFVKNYDKDIYIYTEESVIFLNNKLSYFCKPKGIYII